MLQTELNRRRVMSAGGSQPQYPPYLEFSSPNNFQLRKSGAKTWDGNIQYSTNGDEWQEFTGGTSDILTPAFKDGLYKLFLRGENNTIISGGSGSGLIFMKSNNVECKGDIRTLLDYKNIEATIMGVACFAGLFKGCSTLVKAPDLPATQLSKNCYDSMFQDCTSLIESPILPAAGLAQYCYNWMFTGCSSLQRITMLAETLAYQSLTHWVSRVAATGTFIKNSAMTTLPSGDDGIPSGWTVQDYVG